MAELTAGIARVIEAMVKGKTELDTETATRISGALVQNFKLKDGEVAIMRLSGNGRQLEFIVPEELARIGTLPLTSTTSVAVRTVRDGRPEIINNFPNVKHPTVFEAIPLSKGSREPIQKIISAPILNSSKKTVGVIQISRKGKTGAGAGDDFGPKDLQELTQVAMALAPSVASAAAPPAE